MVMKMEYREFEAMHSVFGYPETDVAAEGHLYNDLGDAAEDVIVIDNNNIFEIYDFKKTKKLGAGTSMRQAFRSTGHHIFDVTCWHDKYDDEVRAFQGDGIYSYLFLKDCALNNMDMMPSNIFEILDAYKEYFGMENNRY